MLRGRGMQLSCDIVDDVVTAVIITATANSSMSESLATLRIIGAHLRPPSPYTFQCDSAVMVRGVSGGPQLRLYDAERR